MNTMEMLRNDTELLEQLDKAQSAEEIATLMRGKGYEVTDENAAAAFAYKNSEELNEDMLDNVAGGSGILITAGGVTIRLTAAAAAAFGVGFAVGVGVGIAALAVIGYCAYKKKK